MATSADAVRAALADDTLDADEIAEILAEEPPSKYNWRRSTPPKQQQQQQQQQQPPKQQ